MHFIAIGNPPPQKHGLADQIFLIMRLSAVFILAAGLQVSAAGYSQKVTLSEQNTSLLKVINEIKKQTGYDFIYTTGALEKAVSISIHVKNASLEEALALCFRGQPLTYSIIEKIVVVKPVEAHYEALFEVIFADVSGRVLNEAGEPIAGATVAVKGTQLSTSTNDGGYFSLSGVSPNATLVISGVNIETYEIKVNDKKSMDIRVRTRITAMGDIDVVANTGFQTISRERSTGSFNVIGRTQLEKPATNIASRLIGTTAGLQASLDVDGNPEFRIRGQSTLIEQTTTQPTTQQPLVVVDGFPIQGDFNSVNPNDVESITVLKDAAAASIWGARSANGVIVIVTRSAKRGIPLKVELNAFTRMGGKFDLDYVRPLASSAETVEYEKMAFNKWSARVNSGSLASDYGKSWSLATVALSENYLGFMTDAERDAELDRLAKLDNRQQIKNDLLAKPTTQQINLNLFGSSGRMSNALSLLFEADQSNFKETNNNRYMINYRTSVNVFKWLDFNASGMVQYNKYNNSGVSLDDINDMSPYEMLRNPDGSLTNISQYYWPILERFVPMDLFPYADWTYNPVQEIQNRDFTRTDVNTRFQAGLTVKLIKGLSFDSKVQYEIFNTNNRDLYNDQTFYVRSRVNIATTWDQATNKMTPNLPKGGMLSQSRTKAENYNFRNQINFNREFGGRHEVNMIAGSEVNNVQTEGFNNPMAYGYNDETLTLGTFPNGPGGTFSPIKNWLGSNQTFSYTNSFTYRTERYFSMFGNAAYTFDGKYTLSGSYRTDASNLITDDPKYRYDPFWSVGVGWQAYREKFMQNVSWIDRLALRITYGYNGNVDRTTAFMPLIAMNATPNTYTNDYTATISSFGNPTLRWEKTGTFNVGIDYALFKGKLFGKLDVYNKKGKDLIAQLSIPAANGTTSQKLNNAAMTNKGFEIELGTALWLKRNDISWRGSLNFSYNKNRITKLFVANYSASTLYSGGTGAYVEGEDANSLWRFEYAGVVNTQPMVKGDKGTLYDFGAFTPGNGLNYLLNMGTTVAPYTFGFINAFQVYDFNISFIFTGKFGHVFQREAFNYPPTWTTRVLPNNKLSEVLNGDPQKIVPLPQNDIEPRYYFWDRFHQYLSYLVESASHIRMQELNVSYNLSRALTSKLNMSRLQVYAQGNDLFTIWANNTGEDPEYPLGTMNPQPKLTLGFRCEF